MTKDRSRKAEALELALERARLGVWDWDLRSGKCYYSPTWSHMLGYGAHELSDTFDRWLKLTHPDDKAQALESGERHIAGLTDTIETELRLQHKSGGWVWVLDRGGIVERDAEGRPIRVIGVQTDITRQKEAEAQLEQANARLRLALAATGIGIWHHELNSPKSYWDARTREIYGVVSKTDEVSADLWHTFLHPEDKEATERAHLEPLENQGVTAVEYRIVRRDGEIRHIESLVRYLSEGPSAGQILGTVRDITEERQRQQELAFAARHDVLTGLWNRTAFEKLLSGAIGDPLQLPLAVFYVDIDYFKALNDFAGHAAGDVALKNVTASFVGCLPPSAFAARLGGDEFAMVFPNCDAAQAKKLAEAILAAIRNADLGQGLLSRKLAASVGIALITDCRTSVADALANADDACYAAKAAGRNRFAVFSVDGAGARGLNSSRVATDTLEALDEGTLQLFGQQIHLLGKPWQASRRIEVLARLTTRNGTSIPPGDFVKVAERFGLASRVDRWIILRALSLYGAATRSGEATLCFNLSAQTLSDPQLWSFVDSLIEETGSSHAGIGFEITETAAVTNYEAAAQFVQKARERQCRVSLDDFGAGMSSFEYLRRFPVDSIKIDGSFVENITHSRFDREIVVAVAGIAKSLGCSVVAERIEQEDVLDMLYELGIDYGQGYLLHRPEPLEALIARAASNVGS